MRARLAPQTLAIEEEPFDSRMSETTRKRVGRLVFPGQHRSDGALGQGAVADLTPAYTRHAAHFAY